MTDTATAPTAGSSPRREVGDATPADVQAAFECLHLAMGLPEWQARAWAPELVELWLERARQYMPCPIRP